MPKTIGQIIEESNVTITDEDCRVCKAHETAYGIISSVCCPSCNKPLDEYLHKEEVLVGETNVGEDSEIIEMMEVATCNHCGKRLAFKPIPIIYNGNHDVYYTGGASYVPGLEITLSDEIKESIEQYTQRIKAGENLDSWHLNTWIGHNINSMVAGILKKNGLKF